MGSTTIAMAKSTKIFPEKVTLAGFSGKKDPVLVENASASTAILNVSRHFKLSPRTNATIPSMTIAMVWSTNPPANARQARNSTVTTVFPGPKEKASAKAANSSVSPMVR
jgi:tRNA A37 threonylcarbamoyladenosine dehydratase